MDNCELHRNEMNRLNEKLNNAAEQILYLEQENSNLKNELVKVRSSFGNEVSGKRKVGPKQKDFSKLSKMQQRKVTQTAFNTVKGILMLQV